MSFFKTIIATRGYHVCKKTSGSNAKTNEEVKVELEAYAKSLSNIPYFFAIKAKHSYFVGWRTVGHMESLVMFLFLLNKKMEKVLVH